MQKHVNLVDLVKSFPTSIFLQNLASIQQRTSPIKFAHLADKSEKGSISNLSTKVFGLPLSLSTAMRNIEENINAPSDRAHCRCPANPSPEHPSIVAAGLISELPSD